MLDAVVPKEDGQDKNDSNNTSKGLKTDNVADAQAEKSTNRSAPECQECEKRKIEVYCNRCDAALCKTCSVILHASKILQKHVQRPWHESDGLGKLGDSSPSRTAESSPVKEKKGRMRQRTRAGSTLSFGTGNAKTRRRRGPPSDSASLMQSTALSNLTREEEEMDLALVLKISSGTFIYQLGWYIVETLAVPFLIIQGVSPVYANMIPIISPIAILLLHPVFGNLSDNCTSKFGRRRPFVFMFTITSLSGMAVMAASPVFDFDKITLTILLVTGALLTDISSDLMSVPIRALLNDNVPDQHLNEGNAVFTSMVSIASIVGAFLPLLDMAAIWPFSLYPTNTLLSTAAFAAPAMILSLTFVLQVKEDPISDKKDEAPTPLLGPVPPPGTLPKNGIPEGAVEPVAASCSKSAAEEEEEEPGLLDLLRAIPSLPNELIAVWCVSFFWWLNALPFFFWWSTWIGIEVEGGEATEADTEAGRLFRKGVHWGFVTLLAQAVVAFVASGSIPPMNRAFGVCNVLHVASGAFSLLSASTMWVRSPDFLLFIMIITGVLFPVINTNPFILVEMYTTDDEDSDNDSDDEEEGEGEKEKKKDDDFFSGEQSRGILTALMSMAMNAAQLVSALVSILVSALVSILVLQYWKDLSYLFLITGIASFSINVLIFTTGWSKPDIPGEAEVEEELREELVEEDDEEEDEDDVVVDKAQSEKQGEIL
eukprot:g39740.t1